ncbi:DUF202 domain-containing protein [Streptomyces sp. PR69]|uniref:DUF202 domain-containing protein n=1 Tax=Streptomyces sp. PR69 TaxID=2984950 RepID=UPI002264725A|nr:DUF202 domain-containing protein [Streptomyces sp. PR69]
MSGRGPGDGPAPARDPGLQPERTRLAWRRTTLTCTVVAVLAGKGAVQPGPTAVGAAAVAVMAAVWLCFLAVAHRRIGAAASPRPDPLSHRAALAATGCVLGLALAGCVMVAIG